MSAEPRLLLVRVTGTRLGCFQLPTSFGLRFPVSDEVGGYGVCAGVEDFSKHAQSGAEGPEALNHRLHDFHRFFGGEGLGRDGMSITFDREKTVEAMNGKVWREREPGEGSTWPVEYPTEGS